MELHNGKFVWKESDEVPFIRTSNSLKKHYDVVIVGGGMSGSICANTLANEGLTVAVMDKGKMGQGSTMANTGLLQYSNDIMLHELIEQIGEEHAVRFYQQCAEAVDQLEKVAGTLETDSHFIRRNSLYYASEAKDKEKLQKEFSALHDNGFAVTFLEREEIERDFPFSKAAALKTYGDAEVNPYRFSRGILQHLTSHNRVDMFEQTEVLTVQDRSDGVEVFTSEGKTFAGHVIFTTGYEKPPLLEKSGVDLNRTFAMATEPLPDLSPWKDGILIWETRRPYLYLRTTIDGRIIAGGLDEDRSVTPHNEKLIRHHAERLKAEVEKLFPMFKLNIAYSWAAVFGESQDNLPFIGKHPTKNRIYYLLGYGGNGTVYSMLGSTILKDLLFQKNNPDAQIVSLDRLKFKNIVSQLSDVRPKVFTPKMHRNCHNP